MVRPARCLFPMLSVERLARSLAFYGELLGGEQSYRLRAAGVKILLEPTQQPWGERVAYAEDPDGNLVMLTS